MHVRDGMSTDILSIGPTHSLRAAARLMSARKVGAAVVFDTDTAGIGILTERDILDAIGAGEDPDLQVTSTHLTRDLVFADPDWSLDQAAAAMVRGAFRHLIVLEDGEIIGMLAMRDIVRCWVSAGVTADASSPRA